MTPALRLAAKLASYLFLLCMRNIPNTHGDPLTNAPIFPKAREPFLQQERGNLWL
jgi:hypothetical protein